jgi:hypothetical protein
MCKQLFRVDQIEISGKCQVSGWFGISFDERMAKFNIVFSLRAVAKVPQHDFS